MGKNPDIAVGGEVNVSPGLVSLNRKGAYRAGVHARSAQDTRVGDACAAVGTLSFYDDAARGAGAHAAAAADAGLGINQKSAHLVHLLKQIGEGMHLGVDIAVDICAVMGALGNK